MTDKLQEYRIILHDWQPVQLNKMKAPIEVIINERENHLGTAIDWEHTDIVSKGSFITFNEAMDFIEDQMNSLYYKFDFADDKEPFSEELETNAELKVFDNGYLREGEVVYFLQMEGNNGPIKIGYTTNIKRRIDQIQPHCPQPLKLLLCIRGTYLDEQRIHAKFEDYALQYEWFSPDINLINYIEFLRSKKHIIKSSLKKHE